MQKEQRKGWKIQWLIRGCSFIIPPMISEFRTNFSARNFHVIYRGAGTETEKAFFPVIFLRNGTSIYSTRKKGTNWCSWRFWRGWCCCKFCVLHIKLFFLLVDIQHSQCPRWFFVLEIQALWSQTTIQAETVWTAVVRVKMSCHYSLCAALWQAQQIYVSNPDRLKERQNESQ